MQVLLRQLSALPLRLFDKLGCGKVPLVKCTPVHQHVASGAPWVGEVSLIQNDDGIPDMRVEEMNPYRRPCCRLSQTPLNRAVRQYPGGQEGHPVGTWLPTRGHGFPMPSPIRFIPMMCLHLGFQQPNRHLLPTLHALYPNPLPLPV